MPSILKIDGIRRFSISDNFILLGAATSVALVRINAAVLRLDTRGLNL